MTMWYGVCLRVEVAAWYACVLNSDDDAGHVGGGARVQGGAGAHGGAQAQEGLVGEHPQSSAQAEASRLGA